MPSRLGVGTISRNAVDASLRLAYREQRPIMLIPSRRQVECERFGGGYVERWSTDEFARYVRGLDPAHLVTLCRDHGGPWQHPSELDADLTESEVMASSMASFRCDIEAGFSLLHIDTSRDRDGAARFEAAVDRLVALYGECHELAATSGRQIGFEIGCEEQRDEADDPREFRDRTTFVCERLARASLPPPTFVVAQTGTKVVETANRGAVVRAPEAVGAVVGELAHVCGDLGVAMKAHNADYLPDHAIRTLVASGVDALNVAPEFGVVETTALLDLLDALHLGRQREAFLELAYASGCWRKWLGPDTATSTVDCAVIAGHYVFGTDEFREIKNQVDDVCARNGTRVDEYLCRALERAMERYLTIVWSAQESEVMR